MEINDLRPIQEDLRGFELYELYSCYVCICITYILAKQAAYELKTDETKIGHLKLWPFLYTHIGQYGTCQKLIPGSQIKKTKGWMSTMIVKFTFKIVSNCEFLIWEILLNIEKWRIIWSNLGENVYWYKINIKK